MDTSVTLEQDSDKSALKSMEKRGDTDIQREDTSLFFFSVLIKSGYF